MIQLLSRGLHEGETNGEVFIIDGRLYKLNNNERLIPEQSVPNSHIGWMYDGVEAVIDGAIYKVHTRAETSQENEILSI